MSLFDDRKYSPVGNAFSGLSPLNQSWPPSTGLAALGTLFSPTQPSLLSGLAGLATSIRRRADWNDRFAHWEKSESDAETIRIERARDMVQSALERSATLRAQGVSIIPQGSFTNRTNARLEADIDLRVQDTAIRIEWNQGVNGQLALNAGGYTGVGLDLAERANRLRIDILVALYQAFDAQTVTVGNKAIRVKGLEGSRSEVDIVPAFHYHRIVGQSLLSGISKVEGVAILGNDGRWTTNYPEQHMANGRAKRLRTNLQFKRVVRIVKRLRSDMQDQFIQKAKPPSFLIECLVYLADDWRFCVATDDRYDRVKRVLIDVSEKLASPLTAYLHTEINGIKPLFGTDQAWTLDETKIFVRSALAHLGNA